MVFSKDSFIVVPVVGQPKRIGPGTMTLWLWSVASLSGLRISQYHELWCRSQTHLGFRVAVAVVQAGSCSSDWTPNLGTSMCHGCGTKKKRFVYLRNNLTQKLLSFRLFFGWENSSLMDIFISLLSNVWFHIWYCNWYCILCSIP